MYQNNISFLYFILIRLFAQKKRNYAVNNKMKNGSYNRQIKKFPTEKQNVSLKHILT